MKHGGTLDIGLDSDPVCVDPSQTSLIASLEVGAQIVNTLLVQVPKTLATAPGLAKSWHANKSATRFSFVLRKGITFSNGQPLDASTVQNYFDKIVAMGAKAPDDHGYLIGYKKTVVTGKYSFTMEFSKPDSQLPIALTTTSLGILAPATMNASLANRCAGKDLYGTGPFVLKSYTPNTSVVEVARKSYKWGTAMGPLAAKGHTGPAYVKELDWMIEPQSGVRSGSLHSGQTQISTLIAPQDEPGLEGGGFHILSGIAGGVPVGMAPNMTGSKIMKDPVVRHAVQLAISRPAIEKTLSKSYGVPSSALSRTTIGWINLSRYLKENQKKADRLLTKDGWKKGANGIRQKNGQPLDLKLLDFYEPNVYQAAAEELRQVGIDLQLDVVPVAQFFSQFPTGNYDLVQAGFSDQDPFTLWKQFGDAALGGHNQAWLTSTTPGAAGFERFGRDLLDTTVTSQRVKFAKLGQKVLIRHNYYFPLSNIAEVFGVSNRIKAVSLSAAKYLDLYNAHF